MTLTTLLHTTVLFDFLRSLQRCESVHEHLLEVFVADTITAVPYQHPRAVSVKCNEERDPQHIQKDS